MKIIALTSLLCLASLMQSHSQTAAPVAPSAGTPDAPVTTDATQTKTLTGTLIRVTDGDTIVFADNAPQMISIKKGGQESFLSTKELHVRLNAIDAPEKRGGQDFCNVAKAQLETLIKGKPITIQWFGTDLYGRSIGTVIVDGKDINLEMVKLGLAWYFRKYDLYQTADEKKAYDAAETAAKTAKAGLWKMPNPVPPWDWRKNGYKAVKGSAVTPSPETTPAK